MNDTKRFSDEELHDLKCQVAELVKATQANTDAIAKLTENTAGIIQSNRDWEGATRIGVKLQRFAIWLLKWGAIGAGVATGARYVLDHLPG